MQRVLSYKKTLGDIMQKIVSFVALSLPVGNSDKTIWTEKHSYENKDDYLFLSDKYSTKNNWHPETLSLIAVSISLVSLFVFLISLYFAIPVLVTLTSIVAVMYLLLVVFKVWVVYQGRAYKFVDFTEKEVAAITDEELPVYTILVPLLNESEVMEQIITALSSLDYPTNKLDIIVTMHDFDTETVEAFKAASAPEHFRAHMVPETGPKTKPKDINTAFGDAKGEFFVIYDAEILPDRDQMKKAYLGFKKHPEIACFQTRLDHYNTDQNILTRLFNMEFSFYYDYFLPGLQKLGFPLPLSGHSTHFRTDIVRKVGAWDPYNVAEDCDVGIRLYRYGYKTKVLNSLSREEAAADVWSWIMQRTRWMKGFMQTSIVHLRHPFQLKDDLGGWKNFTAFLITVPGTVLVNVLNLFSWMILLFWVFSGSDFIKSLYMQPILYISVTSFVVGIFLFTYLNLIGSFNRKRFHLVKYGLLTPFYWLLLAFATTRAVIQLFTNPFKWEKTTHGTHLAGNTK